MYQQWSIEQKKYGKREGNTFQPEHRVGYSSDFESDGSKLLLPNGMVVTVRNCDDAT